MGDSFSCAIGLKTKTQICYKDEAEKLKLEALPQKVERPQLRFGTGVLQHETWIEMTPTEFRKAVKEGSLKEGTYNYIVMDDTEHHIRMFNREDMIGQYGKELSKELDPKTKLPKQIGHTSMLSADEYEAVTKKHAALVLYAGHIEIGSKGKVIGWSNASGHFQPDVDDHDYMIKVFGLTEKAFDETKWKKAHQAILNELFGYGEYDVDAQASFGHGHHGPDYYERQHVAPYYSQDHLTAGRSGQFAAPYYVVPQQYYYGPPQFVVDQGLGGEQLLVGVVFMALVGIVLLLIGLFGCLVCAIPRILSNNSSIERRKVQYRPVDDDASVNDHV